MDYLRGLGPLVLDHRFRRLKEQLLAAADALYRQHGLDCRPRWTSTLRLLEDEGALPVTEIAARLRLTHPAVIGITDEMRTAGFTREARDKDDARRRLVLLTPKARRALPFLHRIWSALAAAQRERFAQAGCDIMAVLAHVEDGLAQRSLVDDVNRRLARPARVRRTAPAALAAALLLLPVMPARTQDRPGVLIQAIADSLINGYVSERTARTVADTLQARLRAGRFDGLAGRALAESVTVLLRRLTRDGHLGVRYEGPGRPPPRIAPLEPAAPPAAALGGSDAGAAYGFERVAALPDDIAYIDLNGFSGDPAALRWADSVMASLGPVRAVIFDVGRNRGGGPDMVRLLSTYLFEGRVHLVSSLRRGMPAPMERWTLDSVRGPRLPRVPVFVLTSRRTISAAESFVFGLRATGRATVIGEPTAGGGHFGEDVALPGGFAMFLPRGRTFDPRTNEGWEAAGIPPDIAVPYEQALAAALRRIREGRH
jgi:DNA-binding MarR family transcriptional regulator